MARAGRALGPNDVGQAVAKVRAIIGPRHIPPTEPAAQAALDALRNGDAPTPAQLAALELVVRLLRPVVFARDHELLDLPDDAAHNLYPAELKDLWSSFRATVKPLLPSIGCIQLVDGDGSSHVGTGFLVADGVLATARHVLAALTSGTDVLAGGVAQVVFRQEDHRNNSDDEIVPIDGVLGVHKTYDMALLAVPRLGRPVVPIARTPAADTDRVAVIGFPAEDTINNPIFLAAVFNGRYNTKRAALGEVLDGTESPFLFHDCSTTQGNSGSPVFALQSGEVVGLHRAGFFMYRNEAVDATALDAFVAAR